MEILNGTYATGLNVCDIIFCWSIRANGYVDQVYAVYILEY